MTNTNSNTALQSVILKLDNHIDEIRCRSLDTLVMKLDHGLVNENELTEDNQLISFLLKWFANTRHPKTVIALKLILRLCEKVPNVCEQLIHLNAISVLSNLKPELNDIELEKLVDHIAARLFVLPDLDFETKENDKSKSIITTKSIEELPTNKCNHEPYQENTPRKHPKNDFGCAGIEFASFPWINVSETDLKVLYKTNTSFQSLECEIVNKSLDFFVDIILKDFSPEIFLQYPQLLNTLLSIANGRYVTKRNLVEKAINCLQHFVKALNLRVNQNQDTIFFTCSKTEVVQNQRHNLQSFSKVRAMNLIAIDNEPIGGDSCEITLPQLCFMIFTSTEHSQQSNSSTIMTALLKLFYRSCKLLPFCINNNIWNDSSNLGRHLVELLKMSFDTLAKSVVYHHQQLNSNSKSIKIHRLAYLGLINVFTKLLSLTTSVEMFNSLNFSAICFESLLIAALDFTIYKYKPYLHAKINCYLEAIENLEKKYIYLEAMKLVECLKTINEFLVLSEFSTTNESMLQSAKKAVELLNDFLCLEVVDKFSKYFFSEFTKFTPFNVTMGLQIMDSLLHHREVEIRKRFHSTCLQNVMDCIVNVNGEEKNLSIYAILCSSLLKNVILIGLQDETDEICAITEKLVIFLMTNVNINNELAKNIFICIAPLLPFLLVCSDSFVELKATIADIFDNNLSLSTIEQIKFSTLLLFSKDIKLRHQAVLKIAWLLTKDENSLYKIPSLSDLNVSILVNTFVEAKLPDFSCENKFIEDVGSVLLTFLNPNEELNTRREAGVHLSKNINVMEIQRHFKDLLGPQQICKMLNSMVWTENKSDKMSDVDNELVSIALEILFKFLICNENLPEDVFGESIFYTLLRIAILRHWDEKVIGYIASIFSVMLFNEFLNVEIQSDVVYGLVSSHIIFISYKFPFINMEVRERDCYLKSQATFTKRLQNGIVDSFIRFYINDIFNGKCLKNYNLLALDQQLLKISEESRNLETYFYHIMEATSHTKVMHALKVMQLDILSTYEDQNVNFNIDLFVSAFERYLNLPPKSEADCLLLKTILQFFDFLLTWSIKNAESMLAEMCTMLTKKNGVFQHTLNTLFQTNDVTEKKLYKRPLSKEIITLITTMLSKSSATNSESEISNCLPGFIKFVHQCLLSIDHTEFYNLAMLETSLFCLIQISARPGFSHNLTIEIVISLCRQLSNLIIDAVNSYQQNIEKNCHSFMGQAIILSTSICLSQIFIEIAYSHICAEWISGYLKDSDFQKFVDCIIYLTTHPVFQIRTASLNILVSLTISKESCKLVISETHHLTGGLWSGVFTVLLNHSELSIVREQAALLINNLLVHVLREKNVDGKTADNFWFGPYFASANDKASIFGLSAIEALLTQHNFLHEVAIILYNLNFHSSLTCSASFEKVAAFKNQSLSEENTFFDVSMDMLEDNCRLPTEQGQKPCPTSCAFLHFTCQVLNNLIILLPELIIPMKYFKMFDKLERLIEICNTVLRKNEIDVLKSSFCSSDVIKLLKSIVDVFAVSCQDDKLLCLQIINSQLLTNLMELLDIKYEPIESAPQLWHSLYSLFATVVVVVGNEEGTRIIFNFFEQFPIIFGNLERSLSFPKYLKRKSVCLTWLVQVFKICTYFGLPFIKEKFDCCNDQMTDKEPGHELSSLLIALFKSVSHYPSATADIRMMSLVTSTLGTLLAVSQSAKRAALENDLISLIMNLLCQAYDYTSEVLSDKNNIGYKKELENLTTYLICNWNLLKNLLHSCLEAKMNAIENNLCSALSLFWDLTKNDSVRLLPTLLSLICTFLSQCPMAVSAFCKQSVVYPRKSLFKEILKYCYEELNWVGKMSTSENLDLAFTVLATVCTVPNGCILIVKSKLFHCYENLNSKMTTTHDMVIPSWWLKVFVNMTFLQEGRETVINLSGVFRSLLNMLSNKETKDLQSVMLIIRNLCFLQSKKNRLLNSDELLPLLTKYAFNLMGDQTQLLAASAMLAFLANNSKGKRIVKSNLFWRQAEDTIEKMKASASDNHLRIIEILQEILNVL